MLSNKQKYEIVFNLGYPPKILDEGSLYYSRFIDRELSSANEFVQDQAIELLKDIKEIKGKIKKAPDSFKVAQVGEIRFNLDSGPDLLKNELNRTLKELSSLLDLPLYKKSNTVRVSL
jgi:hypothetical protein